MAEQWALPAPPDEAQQEGARWRWHRPPSERVAEWFTLQRLDDGMSHEHYVGGIVLIPQNEKVKYTKPDGGQVERYEQVFTPYIQIGTRLAYFHQLAEYRELVPVIEPVSVPRSQNAGSPYFNGHMDDGLWWYIVASDNPAQPLRYLCATWRVALYRHPDYAKKLRGEKPLPVREGRGTKQVTGGADPNAVAKAQTGAIGRALGVAGILVIGTGIATAEDMQELPGYGAHAPAGSEGATLPPLVPSEVPGGQQPPPLDPTEELEALRSRAMALQTEMQEHSPELWQQFVAWWNERKRLEGWNALADVPLVGLKPIVAQQERMLENSRLEG